LTDAAGFRATIGVLVSSPNTVLEHELYAMAPAGITFHAARLLTDGAQLGTEEGLTAAQEAMEEALGLAARQIASLEPDHVIAGMSLAPFKAGFAGHPDYVRELEASVGAPVTTSAAALVEALATLGAESIALLTPLTDSAGATVARYFEEAGLAVERVRNLACPSARAIAALDGAQIARELLDLGSGPMDAVVQIGTNLAVGRVAALVEALIGKPVVACNAALLKQGLRAVGVQDQLFGFGKLLEEPAR
jgi:maleate isomerase